MWVNKIYRCPINKKAQNQQQINRKQIKNLKQKPTKLKMMEQALRWLVDIGTSCKAIVGMAIGPILGYVSQYRLINMTKSVGSFSIDICGILLFANILRLNFYIFKRYQSALVFQSIFMISMQIILLRECCKYPASQQQKQQQMQQQIQPALQQSNQQNEQEQHFWRWKGFQKFGVSILFFVFCTFSTSFIFYLTPAAAVYGEFVGILALMSQSILIAPQIYKNYMKQTTKGLSTLLVTFNELGDIFKLIYFIVNNQPFQFILCGVIQVTLDTFVILQIFYYNAKEEKKRKKTKRNQATSPMKPKKIKDQKQMIQAIESAENINFNNQNKSSEEKINPKKMEQKQLRNMQFPEHQIKKKNSTIMQMISQQFKKPKDEQNQNYVEISDEQQLPDEQSKHKQIRQQHYAADTEANLQEEDKNGEKDVDRKLQFKEKNKINGNIQDGSGPDSQKQKQQKESTTEEKISKQSEQQQGAEQKQIQN